MSIPFIREDPLPTGVVEELGRPGGVRLRRIRCGNPGAFTFLGTNTYLIGEEEVAVIDPGPVDAAHHGRILAALGHERVSHILVTHTHRDHSPGTAALQASTGAPTLGFGPHQVREGADADSSDLRFDPDHPLADGEAVAGRGWRLTALHTPGHCGNHLCFALEGTGILFSGDHVMGWSTSVVSPPDGDMAAYMAGLARVAARRDALALPGHGAPVPEPGPFARALLGHREAREAALREALREGGPTAVEALVPRLYSPIDPRLLPAAGRSLLAHLLKLEAEGAAQCLDGLWSLRAG